MPRPKKYDWDDKRDICHKLFVEQQLPASAIIDYFANHFNIDKSELPNKAQFCKQFKVWGFPPRAPKISEEEEVRLAERTKELFSQNLMAGEIMETLKGEGWEVDAYSLRKLRRKHNMLMKGSTWFNQGTAAGKKRKTVIDPIMNGSGAQAAEGEQRDAGEHSLSISLPQLPPEEEARRAQNISEGQIQSDHLLQTRKRRRRIRGFGHFPPDAQGLQPRYGSETSLDECKAYLLLSNEMYLQIREAYQKICVEEGITKMTACQEGQWQASKDRLTRESMHLASVLNPLQPEFDVRVNALNCICTDVTKRMRHNQRKICLPDANNILGLDPHQSKELRRIFYEILEEDQFSTVTVCGREHLAELLDIWHSRSDLLRQIAAEGDPEKMRAVDVLSRDARKRYCDDQQKMHPNKKQWQDHKHYGPGPGPSWAVKSRDGRKRKSRKVNAGAEVTQPAIEQPPSQQPPSQQFNDHQLRTPQPTSQQPTPSYNSGDFYANGARDDSANSYPALNFNLDPLLNPTAHGPPWPPQAPQPAQPTMIQPQADSPSSATNAYFRLSPQSQLVGHHPRMWLGKLPTRSMSALHAAAISKFGAARVTKINGVVKNDNGSEDSWLIEDDDEIEVYLSEAGEKATFVVVLEGGYA